jgi:citrate synthase
MEPTINPLVSAKEATALLGIKRDTLYAYVSRGLVRSVPGKGGKSRRYYRSDLERLKARHDARAGHAAVAGAALRWGEPVLDSAITRIDVQRGPIYRGRAAVELAEEETPFEAVANLLFGGALEASPFAVDELGLPASVAELLDDPTPLPLLSAVVPLLALRDPARFSATDAAEIARARSLVARMATSLALPRKQLARSLSASSIAERLAAALGAPHAASAIEIALTLCADHELNPSTFAARIAASSGADLYACISAALATLSGPKHGGACDRVEAMLVEAGEASRAGAFVRERARRGEAIPGFGHPLYPTGDPRAAPLLDAARAIAGKSPAVRTIHSITRAMSEDGREAPTVDLGLVALASALELPRGSAVAIFAIGRTAGRVAHVLEQRRADFVLRPRARYVGP